MISDPYSHRGRTDHVRSTEGRSGEDERRMSAWPGIERDLQHFKAGLGLLGIKPCSWCGTFYRRSDPGALCDCGESVCYDCIPRWWPHRSPELSAEARQTVERELRQWLVSHHHAEVIGKLDHLPKPDRMMLKLVTGCEQCGGQRKRLSSGRQCHHCDGRGNRPG